MEKGLLIETPPLDAYEQMAADETLCETLPAQHILRFYNWKGSGVTFGYSQRHAAVLAAVSAGVSASAPAKQPAGPPKLCGGKQPADPSSGGKQPWRTRLPAGCLEGQSSSGGKYPRAVVRRPTGGGIVIHETDLTFSFIFPGPGVYFEPGKTYNRLHKSINSAYESAGVNFSLLNEKTKNYAVNNPVMDCFLKPVNMDILYNGKKVLGGALRKFGDRMLYQASFQTGDARGNAGFHRNIILKALGGEFGLAWHTAGADSETLEKIRALARSKYAGAAWNERI